MKISQDTLLGLFFAVTGIVAVSIAVQYPFGTAGRMGPGYFPIIVSSLLVLTGLLVLVRSAAGSGMLPTMRWKPLLLVPGAILVFGLAIETLGLLVAVLLLVILSAATSVKFRFDPKALAGTLAFAGLCSVVFVALLGLPIPIIGSWLQYFRF